MYGSDVFWPVTPERYLEEYLQPQLAMFEVAMTQGHQGGEGSPDRARVRRQIFHDNAWSHWSSAASRAAQRPRARIPAASRRRANGNGR